jgi:aspartate aminotransferase-like enzyme
MRIAKERGLLTFVDAISIVGGDHLYVDKWKIDVCIGGTQKALAAPPVLSFISISEEALEKAENHTPTTLYLDLTDHVKWLKERSETPATPMIPLYFALDVALERVINEGLVSRINRHRLAAKAFYNSIQEAGLTIFAEESARSNTIIAIRVPERIDNQEVIKELLTYYGVAITGGMGDLKKKLFRIGSMGDIRKEFIVRTLTGFYDILNKKGLNIDIKAAIQVIDDVYRD